MPTDFTSASSVVRRLKLRLWRRGSNSRGIGQRFVSHER